MSKIGFGLVTVHISQHFHHSEVMEEVDNKTEKHQLWVLFMCISAAQKREKGYREPDQPVTHTNKLLT